MRSKEIFVVGSCLARAIFFFSPSGTSHLFVFLFRREPSSSFHLLARAIFFFSPTGANYLHTLFKIEIVLEQQTTFL
jgi:hypothetical protein